MKVPLELLPDSRIVAARPELDTRLKELAHNLTEDFPDFCDTALRELLKDQITMAHADEGTVWLLDPAGEFLLPRFNSGENAARFITDFRQSIREGMISMVVATEQPVCENDVQANERQDKTLDRKLGLHTCAMLAVPLYYLGELRGVLSAVQLVAMGVQPTLGRGFTIEDLAALERTATIASRLIERHLLLLSLGMEGAV